MKKIILIAIICIIGTQAYSQWNLTGNAGTNTSTNFIGTTDAKAFKIRTNNAVRITINSSGKVGIGTSSPVFKLDVKGGSINTDSLYRIGGVQVLKRSAANKIQIGDATAFVGIGNAAPAYPLDVSGNTERTGNFVNTTTTNTDNFGVYGSCNNTPYFGIGVKGEGGYIGVFGESSLPGVYSRVGLQGYATNGGQSNYGALVTGYGGAYAYGIYASADGGSSANWAGFFEGNVYSSGKVGIGNLTPAHPLDVTGSTERTGNFVNASINVDNFGVYGSCNNTPNWGIGVYGEGAYYGVQGSATLAGGGSRTGLYGYGASGAATNYGATAYGYGGTNAYGIYASASGASTANWAGYFSGNLYATVYSGSDRKLKNDIKPLGNAMSIINQLNPSVYTYKTAEYKQMNLPEGLRYGLIADELQQVLPGLVKKAVQPAEYENHDEKNGKKLSDEVEFNAVNYTEIIPILIGAVKELSLENEELKSEVGSLRSENEKLKNDIAEIKNALGLQSNSSDIRPLTSDLLEQNSPNPFNTQTEIKYRLPETFGSAQLIITDANGKQVRVMDVQSSGSVILNATEFAAGAYSYSLVVDEINMETKQMILTK